jgi:hypothetical protein
MKIQLYLLAPDSYKLLYNVKLNRAGTLKSNKFVYSKIKGKLSYAMQIYKGRGVKLHFRSP